jgi:hypothetical protein
MPRKIAAVTQQQEQKEVEKSPFCGTRVKITIHKSGDKHEIDPVPVSVEGVQFLIKRGEEVEVPMEVAHALKIACETQYVQIKNDDGSIDLEERSVPSYSFSERGV